MTKPILTAALVVVLALSTGCLFSKKKNRTQESSAISSEVEATFRQRWLDKRVAELATQGIAADAARAQADQEFRDRYQFATKTKK
jgi:1,2-phenylacetyl-CoA epoxidase catalytic subunit